MSKEKDELLLINMLNDNRVQVDLGECSDYAMHCTDDSKEKEYPLKKYQIWLGYRYFGFGDDPTTKPEMVAEIEAPSFDVAIYLYMLKEHLESIEFKIKYDFNISNKDLKFDFNIDNISRYFFETEEEAWNTFKK